MKYAWIEQHQSEFRLSPMCRVLEVSPSGYYAWRRRARSARRSDDAQLLAAIRAIQERAQGGSSGQLAVVEGDGELSVVEDAGARTILVMPRSEEDNDGRPPVASISMGALP